MEVELENYVNTYLTRELREIEASRKGTCDLPLNKYERTIIYKYSDDGYESLNEVLRNGTNNTEYGRYLKYALSKLENYTGLCYRSIRCSKVDLNQYYKAVRESKTIVEPSFLSCSKSKTLALYFSNSPLFIIVSKRGKDIEKIAKFGIDAGGQNEKEILFENNSEFSVLNIAENNGRITINLEEV